MIKKIFTDILIIGAGMVGMSVAKQLVDRSITKSNYSRKRKNYRGSLFRQE